MRTVIMRAPKEEGTMVRAAPPRAGDTFARELAIFTAAMSKRPDALLATLTEEAAPAAQQLARALVSGSSAERQATLSTTFGLRSDAQDRLREVAIEAGPLLRNEIHRVAPGWMKSWISDLVSSEEGNLPAPMVTALAERLLREATR